MSNSSYNFHARLNMASPNYCFSLWTYMSILLESSSNSRRPLEHSWPQLLPLLTLPAHPPLSFTLSVDDTSMCPATWDLSKVPRLS